MANLLAELLGPFEELSLAFAFEIFRVNYDMLRVEVNSLPGGSGESPGGDAKKDEEEVNNEEGTSQAERIAENVCEEVITEAISEAERRQSPCIFSLLQHTCIISNLLPKFEFQMDASLTNVGLIIVVACWILPRFLAQMLLYPVFRLLFGTLYPAYASYKAVKTKNIKEYVKWMMYWIVFALFTCAETFTDIFFSFWFPFYYECKVILVIYLLSPATKGSSILYRKFVHPILAKREQEIDEYIAKAKEQGYHTVLNLGSKTVNYATTVLMQTAIKGGGGLMNQIRKSYSLSDLSTEKEVRKKKDTMKSQDSHDEVDDSYDEGDDSYDEGDDSYDEDPRLLRRKRGYSPRRTASSGSQVDLFFPEVDVRQRPSRSVEQNIPLSHIRSSEDVSSGYSSTEPLFSVAKAESREPLVRTSSMGGPGRVRTRASVKAPVKKPTGTEDESGWTPTEPDYESQNETDEFHDIPLSQSFPLSGNLFAPFVRPEYQYLFANLTEDQLSTFINNANCLSSVNLVNPPEKVIPPDEPPPVESHNFDTERQSFSPSKMLRSLLNVDTKNKNDIETEREPEKIVPSLPVVEKTSEVPEAVKTETIDESKVESCLNQVASENDQRVQAESVEIPNSKENKDIETKAEAVDTHVLATDDEFKEALETVENNETNVEVGKDDVLATELEPKKSLRSGKYHKRHAPAPPDSHRISLISVDDASFLKTDDDNQEFVTPQDSPISERKFMPDSESIEHRNETNTFEGLNPQPDVENKENRYEPEDTKYKGEIIHTATDKGAKTTRTKGKHKSGESQVSKLLHLPKLPFSLWGQKTEKGSNVRSDASDTSVASGRSSACGVSRHDSFLSLRSEESALEVNNESLHEDLRENVPVFREMSQSPSSKRRMPPLD